MHTESCNTCTSTQVDSGSLLYTPAPHVTACQCKHLAIIGSKQHFIKKAGTIIILETILTHGLNGCGKREFATETD